MKQDIAVYQKAADLYYRATGKLWLNASDAVRSRWMRKAREALKPAPTKKVRNLMTGEEIEIPADTPRACDPSSELYWSM